MATAKKENGLKAVEIKDIARFSIKLPCGDRILLFVEGISYDTYGDGGDGGAQLKWAKWDQLVKVVAAQRVKMES